MIVLGIYEGHNATACLMKDGWIIAAVNEERFTRNKNETGYPKHAIEFCLKHAGITAKEIDVVALVGVQVNYIQTKIRREASFKVNDWVYEQHGYFKPLLLEGKDKREALWDYLQEVEKRKGVQETCYDFSGLNKENLHEFDFNPIRKETVVKHLNIDENKIKFINHHQCHQYYAYYSSPFRENTLVLTVDAFGDNANATVSVAKDNKIELLFSTPNCPIAKIYRYITLLLGMKPLEHEYKVMGLAPYANSHEVKKSYKVFEDLIELDGLEFKWKNKPEDLYFYFQKAFEAHRFDGISGAVQQLTEEVITKWVKKAIEKTGIRTVVLAGGVAMNIKLNLKLGELDEIEKLFISASPGDESNSIGACYKVMNDYCENNQVSKEIIKPMKDAYLGPQFNDEDVKKAIGESGILGKYKITDNVDNKYIAKQLAEGKTVGICRGRLEFGARALGNRSIIANPADHGILKKINSQIKFRDFWMPFTPSILHERIDEYLENPKQLYSPFMTLGLQSKQKGQKFLISALHPADLTARPQMVREDVNPEYYDLIREFENLTGIGGVLNTSLNLHGSPMVNSPKDAIEVMENSELDMMYFGNILMERNCHK